MMLIPNFLRRARPPTAWFLLSCSAALLSGCAVFSQEAAFDTPLAPSGLGRVYPAGTIATAAQAEQALRDATTQRAAIEARYRNEVAPCYNKFFVTRCVAAGREKRRVALAEVRAVEVEADFIKRRERADQRDQAQLQRAAQDAAEAPQRQQQARDYEKRAADKALQREADLAKPAPAPVRLDVSHTGVRQGSAPSASKDAQTAPTRAEQAVRAANIATFEKKQTEAAAAKMHIVERKARKAAEAKRAAADAAAEAATAAAEQAASAAEKK